MQKTKILFITEYLAPNLSAASEVVYRLADVLTAEYNCEISILGFDDSNEEVINRDSNNFDEYSIKSISDYNKLVSIYGKNRTILFYKFLKSPLCFIQYIRQRFRTINNAYIFEIKKLYKKNNYD